MPYSLTEITERAYEALNDRDLDGFLAFSDPDIQITSLIAEAEGGSFHGHEGVRAWWDRVVVGSLGGIRFALDEIRELDHEMILVKLEVIGEAAGVKVGQTMWQAIQVRDGEKAVWWQPFRTETEALAAIEERRSH